MSRGSAADPLNLLQVMLAKGSLLTSLPGGSLTMKDNYDRRTAPHSNRKAANRCPIPPRFMSRANFIRELRVPLREIN